MSEPFDERSQRGTQRSSRGVSADEWDASFADEDPTRVLSPAASYEPPTSAQDDDPTVALRRPDAEDEPATQPISATRSRLSNSGPYATSENRAQEQHEDQTISFDTSSYQQNQPQQQHPKQQQSQFQHENQQSAYSSSTDSAPYEPELSNEEAVRFRNSRIHFFPALLGWLVTYSLLTFSTSLHKMLNGIFGLEDFESFPHAFAQAIGLASPAGDTVGVWLIIASVLIILSAACGGYAAARMTRFAPAKQGFGVWLWHLIMILFATIMTLISKSFLGTGEPKLSFQSQIGNALGENILGVLIMLALVLTGALLGALFGPRYHKRLARHTQRTASDV